MNNKWHWTVQLGLNYFLSRRNKQRSSLFLSIAGLSFGLITIITVISIMNGLQQGYLDDLIEVESYHLAIGPLEYEQADTYRELLIADPSIIKTSLFNEREVMIIKDDFGYVPAKIRGLQEHDFWEDEGLNNHIEILSGSFDLSKKDSIIIGEGIAKKYNIFPGDTIKVITVVKGKMLRVIPSVRYLNVTGIFTADYPEIDNLLCFTSLQNLESMGISKYYLGVKTDNPYRRGLENAAPDEVKKELLSNQIITWKERYDSFYSALMMEKYSMYIILLLIFLVISINIRSTFERFLFEKKEEFGMLKAIGAEKRDLKRILFIQGALLMLITAIAGVSLGIFLTNNINFFLQSLGSFLSNILSIHTGIELFYFPAIISWREIITTLIIMASLVILSIYRASKVIDSYAPLEIIRYE